MRPFAVFDIDGTLIRWQLYHATCDAFLKLGYISQKDFQPVKDARMAWKQRVHVDAFKTYEHALVDAYDALIKRITPAELEGAINLVFEQYKDQVHVYTRDLIHTLKQQGYLLFAISGSQQEIIQKLADYYDFDDFVGTTYVQQDGQFTGEKIVALGGKHNVLKQLVNNHNASYEASIAVGDSEGDINMLEAVETPIAFNPSQKLYTHARENNWMIILERKNVIYKMEVHSGKYLLV
jgi:HAD superfamily hydrolase (TIGR01490 family)